MDKEIFDLLVTLQMVTMTRARPKARNTILISHMVSGTHESGHLEGSWNESRAATNYTGTLTWNFSFQAQLNPSCLNAGL